MKMRSLRQLSDQMEVLANKLCGISHDELKEKKERHERERTRYGIEWGVLYGMQEGGLYPSVAPVYIGLDFRSRFVDIYFGGTPPLGQHFSMMELGAVINISPFIGVGAEWNYSGFSMRDNASPDAG